MGDDRGDRNETQWTAEQLRGIQTIGSSLLVSAAAGSGKTAILAERCAHLVCDATPCCDIDQLLVVTFTENAAAEMKARMDLGRSVSSAASAARLGDFFQYVLDRPVSLPRQKSALLPIVARDVQGQRVSIYNEATQAKFPLLGLRFKNTSGLHLMQGPITVFAERLVLHVDVEAPGERHCGEMTW